MRILTSSVILCVLLPLSVAAQQAQRGTFKWVDDEGVIHYGDSIPPEYADKPKQRLNDQGVAVEQLEGKKTAEQLAAEKKAAELEMQRELQRRADQALYEAKRMGRNRVCRAPCPTAMPERRESISAG